MNNKLTFSRVLIRNFILFTFLLFISNNLSAQFFQSGQDPASIRWKQIKNEHFQIIFPPEFETEANRLANTLDYLYDQVSKTLNHKPRKISVLLHSQSVTANGMVTWAPKRMELYTTPAQDNYAQDWLDQLAVHESRHVVQIDKLNQGITQIAGILFGQQAVGAVTGLLPRWFLEGDAVNTETALSASGRGRTANFEMEMKALVISRDSLFSYEKALRGSYKDYIPDPYQLGYPMVAWTRKNYGPQVFENSLDYIGKHPYTLFPFPLSLKKQIGLPSRKLYKATYIDLRHQWQTQIDKTPADSIKTWNSLNKKHYTNYQFPQFVNDSTLIAVKSGIDQLTEFVLITKNGKEEKVHTPGAYSKDKFSYADGKYVWAEEIPDARWPNRSFSCIKIGDLRTNSVTTLTRKTRYFAPSLSHDGKKIATVEVSPGNDIFLVVLDAKTGNVLEKIPSPNNDLLQIPEWLGNGREIVMVSTDRKGKSLIVFDVELHTWKTLISHTNKNITLPADAGEYILFTADYNGTDNLYAINRKDTSIHQVTSAIYGITGANYYANGRKICFVNYTSQGFNIASTILEDKTFRGKNETFDASPKLYLASAKQENFNFQDSVLPNKKYQVSHYSKLAHIINIHSWAPFYYDYNNLTNYTNNMATPGFSLISQDRLSTCVASAGYSYNNGLSYMKAGFTYSGLYPVISFSSSYGGYEVINAPKNAARPIVSKTDLNLSTQVYLPLNLTKGSYITGIIPQITWQYHNEWFYNLNLKSYAQGMNYLTYSIHSYSYLQLSLRDFAPKWGVSLYAGYSNAPFDNTFFSSIEFIQGKIYLPGLLKHHSLKFTLGYQEQSPLMYYFPYTFILFPRGYTTESTLKLSALNIDYGFPICYPDFDLGALLYVKRIRGNFFYDIINRNYEALNSQNKYILTTDNLISMGFDLTADLHFLRIIFPINAGVRMIYLPELKQYSSQLILNVDLSNY